MIVYRLNQIYKVLFLISVVHNQFIQSIYDECLLNLFYENVYFTN